MTARGAVAPAVLRIAVAASLVLGVASAAKADTASVHGVVDLHVQCLLGGSEGRRWLAAEAVSQRLHGGETYRLVGATGVGRTVSGSAVKPLGAPCEGTLTVDIADLRPGESAMLAVGTPSWPLQLRAVTVLRADNPAHTDAVRQILTANGIQQPEVRLRQVLRTDLDGNGTDEVIIAAWRYDAERPSPDARAGDYALVLVRHIVDGQVRTAMLHEQYHVVASEFTAPDSYEIAAIADLNGDGLMEVVVRGRYYEGDWSEAFSLRGGGFEKVLGCGCGL